jgi:hypothetical protein
MSAQISTAQSKAVGPNKKGDSDGYNICYLYAIYHVSEKLEFDIQIFTLTECRNSISPKALRSLSLSNC